MSDGGLTPDELQAESGTALPDKEVVSILDLNADVDLAIDAAAPIDLAAAANLNVAAPIDAAASANILSFGSEATAVGDQGVMIDQNIAADANADATQVSGIDQSQDTLDGGTTTEPTGDGGATVGGSLGDTALGGTLDGDLLNVNVNVDASADIAAPVNGAAAVNGNVAAPINAGVAANIGSIDSDAVSLAQQDAIISQNIEGEANASADQDSEITQ